MTELSAQDEIYFSLWPETLPDDAAEDKASLWLCYYFISIFHSAQPLVQKCWETRESQGLDFSCICHLEERILLASLTEQCSAL